MVAACSFILVGSGGASAAHTGAGHGARGADTLLDRHSCLTYYMYCFLI